MNCYHCSNRSFFNVHVFLHHDEVFHANEKSYFCPYNECLQKFECFMDLSLYVKKCIKANHASVKKMNKTNDLRKRDSRNLKKKKHDDQMIFFDSVTDSDQDIVNSFYNFFGKLYSNCSVSHSLIDEIIDDFIKISENMTISLGSKLKSTLPSLYHKQIDECLRLKLFNDSSTEYKRLQLFKKAGYFIEPIRFKIREINDNQKKDNTTVFTKKNCYGYYVQMGEVLKKFLELPNVLKEILDYKRMEEKKTDAYSSIYNGKLWRDLSKHYQNKIVIALFLYYDDFEVVDPLGSAKGIYKIGGLYFTLAGIPPKYASMIENVFLAQLILSSDLKDFKTSKCFIKIIELLKDLYNKGITVQIGSESYQVYFVLLGILGDNLGVNCLLGFQESFRANYFCRFCVASRYDAAQLSIEIANLLRDVEGYDIDIKRNTRGVKDNCVFNDSPFFITSRIGHVT